VNPWQVIRRRLSKGTLKFTPSENGMSETDSKDIELKESVLQSDSIPKKINNDGGLIDDNYLDVEKTSIEQEALMFNYNRRRATSCVEISPRMVEELRKEHKSQEKADSLDNFLSKLTAKSHVDLSTKQKQPSMTSLQSFTRLTINSKMQSSPDLKPKKTEKFAQVNLFAQTEHKSRLDA
jgi:hypothetical protein